MVNGVTRLTPFTNEADHTTGTTGLTSVSNGETVQLADDYAGGGDPGNWYEYIGSTPTISIDLTAEDFSNETRWLDLGSNAKKKSDDFPKSFTG